MGDIDSWSVSDCRYGLIGDGRGFAGLGVQGFELFGSGVEGGGIEVGEGEKGTSAGEFACGCKTNLGACVSGLSRDEVSMTEDFEEGRRTPLAPPVMAKSLPMKGFAIMNPSCYR